VGTREKRKTTASTTPTEPVPKGKKIKVLTHRPHYIEPAVVPEFGTGTSFAMETKETAPPTQNTEEPAVMPKVPTVELVETKADKDKSEG
jgi:hypothetical protein